MLKMDERLRQRYLRQMGFTPWVAIEPLPGAAPSPLIELGPLVAEPAQPAAPMPKLALQSVPASSAAADVSVEAEATMPEEVTALLQEQHKPKARVATAQQLASSAPTASVAVAETTPSLMFTLQAHRGETVHLWAEQQQADAPGLNREEQQQLTALLKLFRGAAQHEPKRFFCAPTAGRPMTAEIVRPMFDLFLRSLLGREAEVKMLLFAREETVQALFDAPRYELVVRGKFTFLPVSSLSEMLSDPAAHKTASWKAMQAHGFV